MYNHYDPDHVPEERDLTTVLELPPLTVSQFPEEILAWLQQYHLTPEEITGNFKVSYHYDPCRLVSLITNPEGDVTFWQARDVLTGSNPKYINQKGYLKPEAAYTRTPDPASYMIIVEDAISAIRLYRKGYNVHAIVGNRPSPHQLHFLQQLPVDYYILWLDPDEGGEVGAKFLRKHLLNYGSILSITDELEPKYRTDEEILSVLEDYVEIGNE